MAIHIALFGIAILAMGQTHAEYTDIVVFFVSRHTAMNDGYQFHEFTAAAFKKLNHHRNYSHGSISFMYNLDGKKEHFGRDLIAIDVNERKAS